MKTSYEGDKRPKEYVPKVCPALDVETAGLPFCTQFYTGVISDPSLYIDDQIRAH